MLSIAGVIVMLLGGLLAALPDLLPADVRQRPEGEMGPRAGKAACVALFAAGCFLRLWRLGDLPSGLSAEEALVGVQAKSLWQTGGFLFDGDLSALFTQWQGEPCGPLLSTLTAPFVGLMGMTPLATRLPLALISCAAMPAAYALGDALAGKRAGRWCLAAYALCPFFALTARLTYGASAAVCLMPVAVWLLVEGAKRKAALYAGALATALLCYAQDMFFFLSPAFIVAACLIAAAYGMKKRNAVGAALLGLAVCVPALLTLWVNMSGREGFTWLGMIEIPKLQEFDKSWLFAATADASGALRHAWDRLWSVLAASVFQCVYHENISAELYAPGGLLALFAFSVPLIFLGALSLAMRRLHGVHAAGRCAAGRAMIAAFACLTLTLLTLFGTDGVALLSSETNMTDYSAFFLFDVLLMTAGLCRIAHRNRLVSRTMGALFAAGFVFLTAHLTLGGYRQGANVYFDGFRELAVQAARESERLDAPVIVTEDVYPHREPNAAAEMMYLYATDADMAKARTRGAVCEARYLAQDESPAPGCIYLARPQDTLSWDYEGFEYFESAGFMLLVPAVP